VDSQKPNPTVSGEKGGGVVKIVGARDRDTKRRTQTKRWKSGNRPKRKKAEGPIRMKKKTWNIHGNELGQMNQEITVDTFLKGERGRPRRRSA